MDDIKQQQEKFFEYINHSIILNKKISHAYLIETNGYKNYQKIVIELVRNILSLDQKEESITKINNLLDANNYPDLKIINPDGNYIKKETSKISFVRNVKIIYVILEI